MAISLEAGPDCWPHTSRAVALRLDKEENP